MIVSVPEWLIPKHFTPIYLYELIDPRDNSGKGFTFRFLGTKSYGN